MIQSAITISLVPEARGGPFVFWDDLAAGCAQAAKLGFKSPTLLQNWLPEMDDKGDSEDV